MQTQHKEAGRHQDPTWREEPSLGGAQWGPLWAGCSTGVVVVTLEKQRESTLLPGALSAGSPLDVRALDGGGEGGWCGEPSSSVCDPGTGRQAGTRG